MTQIDIAQARGEVLERKLGQLHEPDLQAWAQRI